VRSEKKNPGATSHWSPAFAGSIDAGIVVAEIPARLQSCEIRKTVFSGHTRSCLFRVRSGRKLKITQPPIIIVVGKAFFDINQSNRRTDLQGYAA